MNGIRAPLHRDCVESGSLCSICSSKISSNIVAGWEVDVIKALYEASKVIKLNHKYESSAIAGSTLYIALEGPPVEGLERDLARRVRMSGVERVRVIYYGGGLEKLLEAIFGQRILAVNRVYSSDGSSTLIVKVERRDPGAAKLASLLLKTQVEVEAVEPRKPGVERVRKPDIKRVLERM
jgi:hypothetical protein